MGLSSMVATFGNMLWFYFLPTYYSNEFSATPTEISLIYAVWLAVGALGSTPAGALADIFGRKNVIVLSSFVSSLSVFILALSHSFLVSAIALPISGLGSSFFSGVKHADCGIRGNSNESFRLWLFFVAVKRCSCVFPADRWCDDRIKRLPSSIPHGRSIDAFCGGL